MSFDFDERSDTSVVMNPSALPASDLVDEYEKLSTKYLQAKNSVDRLEQEAYQLKRNSELNVVREATLNDELQSIAEVHNAELVEIKRKNALELDELRSRVNDEKQSREHFEAEVERLNGEIQGLEKCLAEKLSVQERTVKPNETEIGIDRLQFLENLELEHMKRINDVNELSGQITNLKMELNQQKAEIENMKECYDCAKENLNYKSKEYENLQQINETLQEKVAELSSELAAYQTGNVNHNAKGNSLFAEVDDQRQQMRDLLARQKSEYLWMKKRYDDSEREIRRLKRENADIHNEVKECGNMFRKAESDSRKLLAKHAGFLSRENERLKEKLAWTEARLEQTARENNVTWLDSMLEFCRNETAKLKEEVKTNSMRACIAEHAMEEAQSREAKWRFETLKLRCVVIDRELLLEQNKIPFEPMPKHMKKIVEERFGDYTKEQPNIDLETSSKDIETSEATDASARGSRTLMDDINQNLLSETNAASVPNQIENPISPFSVISIKTEPTDKLDETVEIKPDVSTILGNMNDTSSFCAPLDIDTAIKQENKENVNENYLATELAILNPKTPQPEFRTLKLSTQRKQELKQFTQEVANSDTNAISLNASSAENIKTEIPTPPTRIKQKPRKMNFTVNRIICKRAE